MINHLKLTRRWLVFFMVALFLSGLTALPLEAELGFLSRCFPHGSRLDGWAERVYEGLSQTNARFPFIAYGYDWLGFAHFILALLFIGPFIDPVKNKWVIEFGLYACLLVIPFALVAGHFRQIPWWWRLVDCSFGVAGLLPLAICLHHVRELEKSNNNTDYEDQNDFTRFA